MPNSDDAYSIWAPSGGPWSPWVKPILFASEAAWDASGDPPLPDPGEPSWLRIDTAATGYRDDRPKGAADPKTAVVLDLPGPEGVAWAVAVARRGWRPVPLYNAIPGGGPPPSPVAPQVGLGGGFTLAFDTSALVDVGAIVRAMRPATAILRDLAIASDGPPVFLLDADRRYGTGVPVPGRFDNRSISLPTDFPSAVFLRSHGIERVVLVQKIGLDPQEDLAHTLLAWQEGGLAILTKSLADQAPPAKIEVVRPSFFRGLWYRFQATLGLRRAPLGGFGGTIPVPSAG